MRVAPGSPARRPPWPRPRPRGDDKDVVGIGGNDFLDGEVVERAVVLGDVCHLQVVKDLAGKVVALRDLRLGRRDEKRQVAHLREACGALLDLDYGVRDVRDVCLVEVVPAAHLGERLHVGSVVAKAVHVDVAPRDAGAVEAGLQLLLRGDLGGDEHERGRELDDLLEAGMRGGTHGRHVLGKAVEVRGVLGHAHGRHAGKNRHLGERVPATTRAAAPSAEKDTAGALVGCSDGASASGCAAQPDRRPRPRSAERRRNSLLWSRAPPAQRRDTGISRLSYRSRITTRQYQE